MAQTRRRGNYGQLFGALEKVLARDGYMQSDDGDWPWVKLRTYPTAGTADSAGNRIRNRGIRLPDADGGENGCWDAWVKRKVKGVKGMRGPAELWVQYKGQVQKGQVQGDG